MKVSYDPEDDDGPEFESEPWESLADGFSKICDNMIAEGYTRIEVAQALSWTLTDQLSAMPDPEDD